MDKDNVGQVDDVRRTLKGKEGKKEFGCRLFNMAKCISSGPEEAFLRLLWRVRRSSDWLIGNLYGAGSVLFFLFAG